MFTLQLNSKKSLSSESKTYHKIYSTWTDRPHPLRIVFFVPTINIDILIEVKFNIPI